MCDQYRRGRWIHKSEIECTSRWIGLADVLFQISAGVVSDMDVRWIAVRYEARQDRTTRLLLSPACERYLSTRSGKASTAISIEPSDERGSKDAAARELVRKHTCRLSLE